jgi:hypothetical protein
MARRILILEDLRASACLSICFGLALAVGLLPAGLTFAQVKPGDVINPDNAPKVRELLSPGTYWKLQHGMTLTIVPTERIDWPPPYKDATEKHSAQVRLSPDHRSLVGYVAGQPFPVIDANDRDAGVKVMWNNAFRPMYTDDLDARFFGCEAVYEGRGNPHNVVEYEEIGHYRVYNFVGRTEVEPIPIDPGFKNTGLFFMSAIYPFLAPAGARGKGLIRYRYADPNKGDNTWVWRPGDRRLRRISEDALGSSEGVDQFYPDDYEGFAAKNENYEWRLLGERPMLGAVNIENVPAPACPTDGGGSVCPERWQLRQMFIVEGTPRRSRVPEELYSKHVVYVDSEAWVILSHDAYDRKGELFKNFTNWLVYRDRPVPDARIAIYPYKRVFEVAESTTDVKSGLAEVHYLPSHSAPERETWYINMGVVDKNMFTLAAMVKAAP